MTSPPPVGVVGVAAGDDHDDDDNDDADSRGVLQPAPLPAIKRAPAPISAISGA